MKYFTKFLSQLYDLYKESSYFTIPNVNFDQSENTISNVDYQYNIESKSSNVDYIGNFYEFPNELHGFFKLKGKILTHPIPNEYIEEEEQSIVIAGIGTGTMYYRLGDSGEFSTSIPTVTNMGTYTLYYYCEESDNYTKSGIYNININVSIHDYSQDYFTIVSLEDNNTIGWKAANSRLRKSIKISIDNGNTWTSKISSTSGITLATLNTGDKLLIKNSNTAYSDNILLYNYFTSTGNFNVEGNIMSLLYDDNFVGQTTLSNNYTFSYLFNLCNKLISAKHLILPATTLAQYCYYYMFYKCTSLTTAPKLPATTLADHCYHSMFNYCTSLTTAPKLPATIIAQCCYSSMFYYCISLTAAPSLPATTLSQECYYAMFSGCTSLTTAPELPATTLANYCYSEMFYSCYSLTTLPNGLLPATTLASSCYSSMFSRCTSLTTTPELPATTLASYCYHGMFYQCTSLSIAPELPATTLVEGCYSTMFYGCTLLNYVKCLATNLNESNFPNFIGNNWLYNVAATGTFVKNPNISFWTAGEYGIPSGWTVQDAA